jgi:hypothetical protein
MIYDIHAGATAKLHFQKNNCTIEMHGAGETLKNHQNEASNLNNHLDVAEIALKRCY